MRCLIAIGLLGFVLGCGAEPRRPNVLLISLDTTRADRLGCYGYERDTSPNLDRLAAESRLFTRAYSVSSWTLPSHASLFTGKFPSSHGAQYDPDGPLRLGSAFEDGERWDRYRARPVAANERTLAQILSAQGYRTAGVVSGPWMKRVFGLDRGFGHYDDGGIVALNGRRAADVTTAAIGWLESGGEQPFFLFLNYFDPHFPLVPTALGLREIEPRGTEYVKGLGREERTGILYDAELRDMDRELGRLFDWLRVAGDWNETWILVTADHGELLGEGGRYGHGASLREPELRVPLIVKEPGPGAAPVLDPTPVSLVDLLPTVLDELELPHPEGIQGRAIPARGARPIFAEVNPLPSRTSSGDWRAWIVGERKLLWNSEGRHELYDLARDPDETTNQFDDASDRAAMEKALADHVAALQPPERPSEQEAGLVDAETAAALRELGYLEEPAADAPERQERP